MVTGLKVARKVSPYDIERHCHKLDMTKRNDVRHDRHFFGRISLQGQSGKHRLWNLERIATIMHDNDVGLDRHSNF
jgi:hypothetical protein